MVLVEERAPEEAARLAELVDGLTAGRMIEVMNKTVGRKRAAELMAWAVLWGLSGDVGGVALRRKLAAGGLAYASVYRAINDYKRIGDALLASEGYQGPGVFESLRLLARELA